MIPLPRDFQDFLRLLNANAIRYVVIGGYAVAYHGFVRYTGDLDVFVELSVNNAAKLVSALRDFGFDLPQLKPALFLRKGRIVRLGCEPMRLEILNEIDGVSFEECYRHRRRSRVGNLRVNFIALPQLLRNKRASGRPKDLADIAALTVKATRVRRVPGGQSRGGERNRLDVNSEGAKTQRTGRGTSKPNRGLDSPAR